MKSEEKYITGKTVCFNGGTVEIIKIVLYFPMQKSAVLKSMCLTKDGAICGHEYTQT